MTRRRGLLVVALLAPLTAAACGGDRPSVGAADDVLVERYVEPLRRSGLTVAVREACRYDSGPSTAPWHLQATFRVDATGEQVAEALVDTVDVVVADGGGWRLQQRRGRPTDGWNGTLTETADGDGSEVVVVAGNVEPTADGHVAWQQVCPNGPTAGSTSPPG